MENDFVTKAEAASTKLELLERMETNKLELLERMGATKLQLLERMETGRLEASQQSEKVETTVLKEFRK